jgi:hypothetical protein
MNRKERYKLTREKNESDMICEKIIDTENKPNKKYKVKTSDPVINDVIDRIFKRHQQGMEKFKKTMADNSKSIPEWIEESIQEKIDDICYMSTLKDRIVANEEKLKKEMAFVREQAQVDILTKDQELGRAYKKINELSDGKKT